MCKKYQFCIFGHRDDDTRRRIALTSIKGDKISIKSKFSIFLTIWIVRIQSEYFAICPALYLFRYMLLFLVITYISIL